MTTDHYIKHQKEKVCQSGYSLNLLAFKLLNDCSLMRGLTATAVTSLGHTAAAAAVSETSGDAATDRTH